MIAFAGEGEGQSRALVPRSFSGVGKRGKRNSFSEFVGAPMRTRTSALPRARSGR